MGATKINVDNKTYSAVACGQVDLKPRVTWRNRTDLRNFCAHSLKGCRVCDSYRIPVRGKLSAVPVHGFKTPGTLESVILEKNWRFTMLTPFVHPHDRLHHVQIKIEFLATLLNIVNEDDRINFDHPGNANGLYYTLTGFAEEISTAITALEKGEVAA